MVRCHVTLMRNHCSSNHQLLNGFRIIQIPFHKAANYPLMDPVSCTLSISKYVVPHVLSTVYTLCSKWVFRLRRSMYFTQCFAKQAIQRNDRVKWVITNHRSAGKILWLKRSWRQSRQTDKHEELSSLSVGDNGLLYGKGRGCSMNIGLFCI